MDINLPANPMRLMTDDGKLVHFKVVDIPAWDMNATATMNVPHGLGALFTNILGIFVMIFKDALAEYHVGDQGSDAADPLLRGGGVMRITGVNIQLFRRTGGVFDTADYDDVGMNRGKIAICYHE